VKQPLRPAFAVLASLAGVLALLVGVTADDGASGSGARAAPRPFILLTNDDGVAAPGLAAMQRALEAFADLLIVAPESDSSGASQSLALQREIAIRAVAETTGAGGGKTRIFAAQATPASCVHLAAAMLAEGRAIDLVVSGINRGQNVGSDIHISGTVGAARMAQDFGLSAMAVSLSLGSRDYESAAAAAARLAKESIERRGGAPAVLLNLNFPGIEAGRWKDPILTRPGRAAFRVSYVKKEQPGGALAYEAKLSLAPDAFEEGTDGWALAQGHPSLTPLSAREWDAVVAARLEAWAFIRAAK
jgi:5'-nucleotidase